MKSMKLLALAAVVISVSGCNYLLDETNPVSVASAFWSEALSDDRTGAAVHMKRGGKLKLDFKGHNSEDVAYLGEVQQNSGIYFVNTDVSILRNETYFTIPLKTIVVPVNGKWKVDYWSTKSSLNDAAIDNAIKYVSNSMSNYDQLFASRPDQADKFAAVDAAEARLDADFARAKIALMKSVRRSYGVPEPEEKK